MKADIEDRRVMNMKAQKEALLRVNIERMLMNEAIKQRPELRQKAKMVNRIEQLIDLPRVRKHKKENLEDERVR